MKYSSTQHYPPLALLLQKRSNIYSQNKKKPGKLHGVLLFSCLLNEDFSIQWPIWILHYCFHDYNSFQKVYSKHWPMTTCHLDHGNEGEKATEKSANLSLKKENPNLSCLIYNFRQQILQSLKSQMLLVISSQYD